jgi:hypothetical protein
VKENEFTPSKHISSNQGVEHVRLSDLMRNSVLKIDFSSLPTSRTHVGARRCDVC